MKRLYPQSVVKIGAFAFAFWFLGAAPAFASEITAEKVVELVNQDRQAEGFALLQMNEKLTEAAQAKADDMAKNGYFAHTSPNGTTPWYWIQGSGYSYRYAGENLAINFTDAEEEERAWMESVKHRENILSPKYQDIGVAVATTEREGRSSIIVVQMFGLPSGASIPARLSSSVSSSSDKTVEGVSIAMANATVGKNVDSGLTYGHQESGRNTLDSFFYWAGIIVAVFVSIVAGAALVVNRKILYLKYFHREQLLHYRG